MRATYLCIQYDKPAALKVAFLTSVVGTAELAPTEGASVLFKRGVFLESMSNTQVELRWEAK